MDGFNTALNKAEERPPQCLLCNPTMTEMRFSGFSCLTNASRGNGSCLCSGPVHKENLLLRYEQSTLPWSTETKELDFLLFVTLYFVAVDVSQGAVLKNVLIPLVLVTVSHLSGEPCIGSN